MSRAFCLFLVVLSLVAPCMAQDMPGQKLISSLIEALNSKDKAKITAFVAEHCAPGIPQETRVERLSGLADRGAPFKITKLLEDKEDTARAILEDKDQMPFGLRLEMTPDGKMRAAMIGDPAEVEAPAPKNYTGWKDLPTLTEALRTDTSNPAMAIAMIHDGQLEQSVKGVRVAEG